MEINTPGSSSGYFLILLTSKGSRSGDVLLRKQKDRTESDSVPGKVRSKVTKENPKGFQEGRTWCLRDNGLKHEPKRLLSKEHPVLPMTSSKRRRRVLGIRASFNHPVLSTQRAQRKMGGGVVVDGGKASWVPCWGKALSYLLRVQSLSTVFQACDCL